MEKKEARINFKGSLVIGIISILLGLTLFVAHEVSVGNGSLSTSFNFEQTIINKYNITINNTDTGALGTNISMVYIALPAGFAYVFNSSLVGGNTSGVIFSNTSNVLNWTNATTNALIFNQTNQSRISFMFNATASTPGIYVFNISTVNSTGINNYTISVTINDTVIPNLSVFKAPGLIIGANVSQSSIPINVSATDNGILDDIKIKIYFVNGTLAYYSNKTDVGFKNFSSNLTYPLTNSSSFSWFVNFSTFSDGYYNVSAWVNDSYGNLNISMINVTLDTVAPVITHSCNRYSVNTGEVITCTCTATDATSGVKTTTYVANPVTTTDGTFTNTCDAMDYAGNNATSSKSYDVISSAAAPGSGGGGSTTWTKTYVPSAEEITTGYTQELKSNERVSIKVSGKTHSVGITTVTITSATISVASTPQTATLNIGDEKNFDVNVDGYYDLSVKLNKIEAGKADVTIKSINIKVTEETTPTTEETTTGEKITEGIKDIATGKGSIMWIIIAVIVILVLIGVGYKYKKKE